MSPLDAVSLMDDHFTVDLALPEEATAESHRVLARLGIAGGATYDGLVGLAARQRDVGLATRDARARATYEAIGVRVEVITPGTWPQ